MAALAMTSASVRCPSSSLSQSTPVSRSPSAVKGTAVTASRHSLRVRAAQKENIGDKVKESVTDATQRVKESLGQATGEAESARKDLGNKGKQTADDISGRADKTAREVGGKTEEAKGGVGKKVQEAWDNFTGRGKNESRAVVADWATSALQYGAAVMMAGALVLTPVPQAEARSFTDSLLISGKVQISGPTETGKSGGAKNLAVREFARSGEKGDKSGVRDGLRRESGLLTGGIQNPAAGVLNKVGEDAGGAAKNALTKASSQNGALTKVGEDAGGAAKSALNKVTQKGALTRAGENAGGAAKNVLDNVRQSGPFGQAAPSYEVAGFFDWGKAKTGDAAGKAKEVQNSVQKNVEQTGDKAKSGVDSLGDTLQRNTSGALGQLKDKSSKTANEGASILAAKSESGRPNADQGKAADSSDKGSFQSAGSLAKEESKFSTPGGGFEAGNLLKQEKEGRIL